MTYQVSIRICFSTALTYIGERIRKGILIIESFLSFNLPSLSFSLTVWIHLVMTGMSAATRPAGNLGGGRNRNRYGGKLSLILFVKK